MHVALKVEVRDPCPIHSIGAGWKNVWKVSKSYPFVSKERKFLIPPCPTNCTERPAPQVWSDEYDLGTINFLNFVICNIFDTATATNATKDTAAGLHTQSANTAMSSTNLHLGAGVTTVNVGDYAIEAGTNDWGTIAATVNTTVTNNGTNCTSTITGTFSNGAVVNETAGNVGIEVTAGGVKFLMAHDNINGGTGYVVSPSGTVAVTYTITVS